MNHRQRRENKIERLRGWAEKRIEKSNQAHETARSIAENIPFGQPILVGHHSEGKHRRTIATIDRNMRASIDHQEKAESMSTKADNIELALENSIFSDDDDAIERLKERIEKLEAERNRIKEYNQSCRKGNRDITILTPEEQADLESTAKHCPYMIGKNGEMPGYKLTNLSGNINRNKKRLIILERKK